MKKPLIARERVLQLVDYDPVSGLLTRKTSRGGFKAGSIAGSLHREGYVVITLDGRQYGVHRIAWLISTGQWPANEIDHKNGLRSDNRLANLREATRGENQGNRPKQSNNATGIKGVRWRKDRSKWTAQIACNGRVYHLGYFSTLEEANASYIGAASIIFGEFAHHVRSADCITNPELRRRAEAEEFTLTMKGNNQ